MNESLWCELNVRLLFFREFSDERAAIGEAMCRVFNNVEYNNDDVE